MVDVAGRLSRAIGEGLEQALAEGTVVGATTRVLLDGELVFSGAGGFADREAGRPTRETDIFRLASMSKAIVSATTLALMERGKLSLDDTVARHLPEFRPRLVDGRTPDILIRHLLNHTSGLTYGFVEKPGHAYHRANVSDGLDQPGLSAEENIRRILSVPLEFAPGTAWRYSVSIDVLGWAIERITGGPLAAAVREYVTGPLGMAETGFDVAHAARLVPPYADGQPPTLMTDPQAVKRPEDPETALLYSPARVFHPASFQSGGAGLTGTTADYLRFAEAIRRGGAPILKAETVAMARQNQIGTLPRDALAAGLRTSFLGGIVANPAEANTPQSAGTLQFGGAWGTSGFVDFERKLSVVTLTNTALEGVAGTFPVVIRDAIYRALAS